MTAADIPSLRTLPFFVNVPDDILARLVPHVSIQRFERDQTILTAGQYCDGAYYLARGGIEMRVPGLEAGPPGSRRVAQVRGDAASLPRSARDAEATVFVTELSQPVHAGERVAIAPGDIFAETSALSRYPVSGDFVSTSPVTCWFIGTPALRLMFDQPELASFKEFFDARYRQRTLASVLQRVGVFREVDEHMLARLRDRAELLSFKPGRLIVEQGSPSDALYLVRGGYVKVGVKSGGEEIAVTYLRRGDCAGETGLLLDEPWPFSLTALEYVELVKLARVDVAPVLARYPPVQEQLWTATVERLKARGHVLRDPLSAGSLQFAMDSGLIHGESVLLIDLETCTRCDECVRACADTHGGTPKFIREGAKFKNFSVPTACYHCTDPVCMIGCPTGAITRPLGTLEVTVNRDTCIGCGNCVRRCPWNNIQQVAYDSPAVGGEISLASKCDLCIGRADGPACVQMCPHGAAVRVNFKEFDRVRRLFGGSAS